MRIKRCRMCGKEFTAQYGNEQFCSDECRTRSMKESKRATSYRKLGWSPHEINCVVCGKPFMPRSRNTKACSEECRKINARNRDQKKLEQQHIEQYGSIEAWENHLEQAKAYALQMAREVKAKQPKKPKPQKQWYTGECVVCGKEFKTLNQMQRTCSTQCSKKLKYARKHHRIKKEQMVDKDITLEALYRRDSGVCYLCGEVCDWNDYDKDTNRVGDNYPSIDHIIPIARGGLHSWTNIRLAHFKCNVAKSDTLLDGTEELIPKNAYQFKRDVQPRKKQVDQYTKEGEWIASYSSTAEAERITGIPCKSIQHCARGERTSSHGFVWKYPPLTPSEG